MNQEDIVELPRDLIDLSVSQDLARRYVIKISAKDILGQEQVFKEGELKVRSNKRGSTYTVGLSMKF